MNVELKHTVVVDEKTWWLRLYLWGWDANPNQVTFCKLFWGILFFLPVACPLRFLGYLLDLGVEILRFFKLRKPEEDRWTRARKKAEARLAKTNARIAQEERESNLEKWLANVSLWFTKKHVEWARIPYLDRALLAVAVLFGLALVTAIVGSIVIFWSVTKWILIGLGVLIAVSALALGVGYGLAALAKAETTYEYVWQPTGRGFRATGYATKTAGVGFWTILKLSYVAVKSNTCPKIEVTTTNEQKG